MKKYSEVNSINYIRDAFDFADPVEALQRSLVPRLLSFSPEIRLSHISKPAEILFLVDQFRRETLNGGFYSFISNGSGHYASQTLFALKAISAATSYKLLTNVIQKFENCELPFNQMERAALIEKLGVSFEQECANFDTIMFDEVKTHSEQDQSAENLWSLSLAFMKANSESRIFVDM